MRKIISINILLTICLTWAVSASATVINFDSAPGSGNPIITSYAESGFTFTSSHMHTVDSPTICLYGGCVDDGTTYLSEEAGSLGGPITMSSTNGSAFNLLGFDGAEVFLDAAAASAGGFPNANMINVVGTLMGGGTVSALLSLDGLADGAGGIADFQSFNLAGFTNLSSVVFSGLTDTGGTGGISLDNLNVASVPEPGSLLLLGIGLLGFSVVRRRGLTGSAS